MEFLFGVAFSTFEKKKLKRTFGIEVSSANCGVGLRFWNFPSL
jgi:hypothetical protein